MLRIVDWPRPRRNGRDGGILRQSMIRKSGPGFPKRSCSNKTLERYRIPLNPIPKVLAKNGVEPMLRLISATAKESGVELFNRFAVMRYWRETAKIPFEQFLSPDQLHMNDWGYNFNAQLLTEAIVAGV